MIRPLADTLFGFRIKQAGTRHVYGEIHRTRHHAHHGPLTDIGPTTFARTKFLGGVLARPTNRAQAQALVET